MADLVQATGQQAASTPDQPAGARSLPAPQLQGWNPDRPMPRVRRCSRHSCCSMHQLSVCTRTARGGEMDSRPVESTRRDIGMKKYWCDVSHLPLAGCEGMRLRGRRDFNPDTYLELAPPPPSPVAWLPGVLSKGVRLRLRLDRRDNRGRGCWQLVDLEAEPEPVGRRLRSRGPDTCAQSLMSTLSVGSEMQTPALGPQFTAGPQGKVPGRKRGRPPIRKLEFQSHYVEPVSPLKVPKKRGRKPGFKLKPRMVMSPLANSPPSSTPGPEMGSIPQDAAIVPHSATPQVLTAETSMPDDFLCDPPVDSKRYAIDPSDSAFNVMTSQYPPKRSYGYRGSSCSTPMGLCRQASSPGGFQDANRTAYSPMPDSGECKRPAGKDPSSWNVEEVVWFIKDADPQALGPHADAFRKHEIDGDALLLLKSEMMMKYLGLKLGPALKLSYHIDRLKQNRL
ncbi:sex comb on midleg-like protein 4 [Anarhichas minor]|uniref:sex comb on midleg-like protein 4 n=1 Tax=Anarhichas minor TaxID=65739 RepID=UPI003F7324DE